MNRAIRLCFFKKYISIMYTGVVQCVHWPLRPSSNKKWMCSTLNCTFIFYIVWVFGFVNSWAHTHKYNIAMFGNTYTVQCTQWYYRWYRLRVPPSNLKNFPLSYTMFRAHTHTMNIVWELVVYDHHHTVYNIVRNLTSSSV